FQPGAGTEVSSEAQQTAAERYGIKVLHGEIKDIDLPAPGSAPGWSQRGPSGVAIGSRASWSSGNSRQPLGRSIAPSSAVTAGSSRTEPSADSRYSTMKVCSAPEA